MAVAVTNTTAGLSGKTLAVLETAQTWTALQTFSSGIAGTTLAFTGNATIGGTLGVTGATTLTGLLTANGNIKFPAVQSASADANTLDDYEEGEFTGTLTGVSGTVTATIRYTKIGNTVQLDVPQISGTSNATTKTITGMPADLYPAREKGLMIFASDNGGAATVGDARLSSSGVITLYTSPSSSGWTASGTALVVSFQVSYTLA